MKKYEIEHSLFVIRTFTATVEARDFAHAKELALDLNNFKDDNWTEEIADESLSENFDDIIYEVDSGKSLRWSKID